MTTHDGQDPEMDLDIALAPAPATADAPDIWLDPSIAEQIDRYAETDTARELGGVLLGDLHTDGPNPRVRVLAAIEARYTEAVQTSVKFTHETWEDIHRVREEEFPHLKIVGWFHTHPGFGIFLSRWDLFIQQNFFNLPWQIAYVVDPIAHTNGFFHWEDGKVVAVRPSERGGDPPGSSRPENDPEESSESCSPPGPAWWRIRCLDAAVGFAMGAALAVAGILPFSGREGERPTDNAPAPSVLSNPGAPGSSGSPGPEDVRTMPESREARRGAWASHYTVRPGDSLWSIARARYGDGRCAEALRLLNHLPNPDDVPSGTRLLLPDKDLARALTGLSGEEPPR